MTSTHAHHIDTVSKQVYIIHGYAAKPTDHWFPWLKQVLKRKGINTTILSMPNPEAPDAAEWQRALEQQLTRLDDHTYLVAHSLGSIALLHHLQRRDAPQNIGGMILVSGFAAPLPGFPQLDPFVAPQLMPEHLKNHVAQRAVFASTNDAIVPFTITKDLAQQLDAAWLPVADSGHFLGSDGYTRFPQLLETLMTMMMPEPS